MLGHRPADDHPRAQIHHTRQIKPALVGGNVGDVLGRNDSQLRDTSCAKVISMLGEWYSVAAATACTTWRNSIIQLSKKSSMMLARHRYAVAARLLDIFLAKSLSAFTRLALLTCFHASFLPRTWRSRQKLFP